MKMGIVDDKIKELKNREVIVKKMGGEKEVAKQKEKRKLTAPERLNLLFDPGTFREIDMFVGHRCVNFGMDKVDIPSDGVITGHGLVKGRSVFAFAQDFTSRAVSLGEMHSKKICKVMDLALKAGVPFVGFNDSGGARIQEGVDSLSAYGQIFYRNAIASGVIPQISAIMGPTAGGAVYSPAMTDFIFMVKNTSYMFITGPDVIKSVTGEAISFEALGLDTIIPADPRASYDVHDVIRAIVDDGDFFEPHAHFAGNMVVALARLNGRPVGIIANNPKVLAGCLGCGAADKATRFIRFCDAFNIPLLTIADVPGYLPGSHQEWGGIIRHGAKLLWCYAEATVPKITLITRKAYGGAYIAMCSQSLGADLTLAWPQAGIAGMGAEAGGGLTHPGGVEQAEDKEAKEQEKIKEYRELLYNPYVAAKMGYINAVIQPTETRAKIIAALEALKNKKESRPDKKHGNITM